MIIRMDSAKKGAKADAIRIASGCRRVLSSRSSPKAAAESRRIHLRI